jgi:hypothetical protein
MRKREWDNDLVAAGSSYAGTEPLEVLANAWRRHHRGQCERLAVDGFPPAKCRLLSERRKPFLNRGR